jgi:hypothetical protein
VYRPIRSAICARYAYHGGLSSYDDRATSDYHIMLSCELSSNGYSDKIKHPQYHMISTMPYRRNIFSSTLSLSDGSPDIHLHVDSGEAIYIDILAMENEPSWNRSIDLS